MLNARLSVASICGVVGILSVTGNAMGAAEADRAKTPNASLSWILAYNHFPDFTQAKLNMFDGSTPKRGCWGYLNDLAKSDFVVQRAEGKVNLVIIKRKWVQVMLSWNKAVVTCNPLKSFTLNPSIVWVGPSHMGVKIAVNRGEWDGIEVGKCRGTVDGVANSAFAFYKVDEMVSSKAYAVVKHGPDKIKNGMRVTVTCDP